MGCIYIIHYIYYYITWQEAGMHNVILDHRHQLFVDQFSSSALPFRVNVCDAKVGPFASRLPSKSAAHRDKSREWNVSKQKWNLC